MKEGILRFQFTLKKGMEHFPRKKINLPFEPVVWTSYSFDIDKTWSCVSFLAKGIKESACLQATQDVFTFQVCFLFCWILELVTYVATPSYLYFQVLCQALASNGRESKSYDMLSRNRLCTLHWKIPRKSSDHLFDPNCLHSMLQVFSLILLVLSFLIGAREVPL